MSERIDIQNIIKEKKCCIIIPTYNNGKFLEAVIKGVLKYTDYIIIVNDGSTDETENILSKYNNLTIISYNKNKGKGYALRMGFNLASDNGFHYAITIDSDGQHDANDIPVFLETLINEPEALIIGTRKMPSENVSRKSSFANKFSNFWFNFITGIDLPDTQSGYRLYPLKILGNIKFFTRKYEFEIEVLVRAAWQGIKIISVPVHVYYPPKNERITHFRPFKDFSRISILNTVLVFITLLYIKPFAFLKYLRKNSIKEFFKTNLFQTKDSNFKIVFSVMLGLFMGIAPIWGYQLIAAIALAHFLKLNKLIVIVAANISIPPMIPIILYFSYLTGGLILANNFQHPVLNSHITFAFVKNNLIQYIIGSIGLALIVSVFIGLIIFLVLKIFRKAKPVEN